MSKRIKIETKAGPRWIAALEHSRGGFYGVCYSYRWIDTPSGWAPPLGTLDEAMSAAREKFTDAPPPILLRDKQKLEWRKVDRRFAGAMALVIIGNTMTCVANIAAILQG